jgi:hypothetical protein
MNNKAVIYSVAALLALEFGVYAWLLTHGTRKDQNQLRAERYRYITLGLAAPHVGPRYRPYTLFN